MDNVAFRVLTKELTPLNPIPTNLIDKTDISGRIRAVLFDVYGTLLVSGSGDIGTTSMETSPKEVDHLFRESGYSVAPGMTLDHILPGILKSIIECHHQHIQSEGIDYPEVDMREIWSEVLAMLRENDYLSGKSDCESRDALAFRYENMVNPIWPMPGFPHILHRLKGAHIKLGIVSNAQFYTPILLEELTHSSLSELGFETQYCEWSYKLRRAKPSLEIFAKPLKSLESIGILPHEVLFVGNDMLNDISTASKSGCRTCLFAGDRRSLRLRKSNKSIQAKPDMVITHLSLLECLMSEEG